MTIILVGTLYDQFIKA